MRRIRSKGMKPEMIVRKLAHAMGYRYRLHAKDLPGKPDMVFPARRRVIFVHGCFWHQHAAKGCKIARIPRSNREYWLPKLQRNVERDQAHCRALRRDGWGVMTVWECQTKDTAGLQRRLRRFLGD